MSEGPFVCEGCSSVWPGRRAADVMLNHVRAAECHPGLSCEEASRALSMSRHPSSRQPGTVH